ncbi:hypothetical protein GT352_20150 [Streptomyces sp. SID1046]|uniref:hypothetical protein n=1 Tax=Streptomyces sp. SID1046 TaxID=2690249 RepID=UPI001370BEA4|nr:hypothetical protein [Streptomyces sp. SID1046]MYV76225.1 hypothetical protein [Streptomyces sp. SID1046]
MLMTASFAENAAKIIPALAAGAIVELRAIRKGLARNVVAKQDKDPGYSGCGWRLVLLTITLVWLTNMIFLIAGEIRCLQWLGTPSNVEGANPDPDHDQPLASFLLCTMGVTFVLLLAPPLVVNLTKAFRGLGPRDAQ